VSIDARLDCDSFASTHSATSHYGARYRAINKDLAYCLKTTACRLADRQSFVGYTLVAF